MPVIVDINDQKNAENALKKSEEAFKNVFDNSVIGKSITHMNGSMKANPAFYQMLDYTEEEFSLLTWQKITHPDDIAMSQMYIDQMHSGTINSARFFKRYLKKDGSIIWVNVSTVLQKDKEGKPLYYITSIVDITKQKEAEEILAAEKERLSVTLRSIADAVIATDVQGKIILMNKVAEKLTGWTIKKAADKPLYEVFKIVNEYTRIPIDNFMQKVFSSSNIIELVNHSVLISHDGTERLISESIAPIKDKNDKIIGVVLVFRDITEKQKYIDAMQRSAKLDSLGILAGGIAHDFNNLLSGTFGYLDLAHSLSKETKVIEYLEKSLTAMNRAKALTQQLLTFAKEGTPVQNVTPLIPFIQETALFALSGSNISCQFDLPENLYLCNIDKNQIGQVIDNIVINAQQAMPNSGIIILTAENISLKSNDHPTLGKGDYVKISIKDFGIGIPKEIISNIFDPFYTTKIKGHGLGLTTCYSIINRHGGCIDVESEPGKGSIFHVYLPASKETATDKDKRIIEHKGNGLIMVADDEKIVLETFREMLETMGYTIICKNDGKECLDFYIKETKAGRCFTALILDLTMPGSMGGAEIVNEIRKFNKEIPIFVTSGYTDNIIMKNLAEYGFTASITKPFTISDLSELLNKVFFK